MKEYKFIFFGKVNDPRIKEKAPNTFFYREFTLDNIAKLAEKVDVLIAAFDKTWGNTYTSNMKVFDYMCLERPIIVSDVGELKKYIHYPRGGYVVKRGDKEGLKRTIQYIKTHYKEAMKKARYARRDLPKLVESWEERRKNLNDL